MKTSPRFHCLLVALLVTFASPRVAASQVVEACSQIAALVAAGQFIEAMEEINWCEIGVSELHYERLLEILEVTILGYAPGEGEVEAMMGMSTVDITHTMGTETISTTLTSGIGGADSPMAGLGALAGLSSALSVRQPGMTQVRIGRTSATLEEKRNGEYSLMATLEGGQILTHTGTDPDRLQEFMERVIVMLMDYLGD